MLLLFIYLLKSLLWTLYPCHSSISLLSFATKLNTISCTHWLQFLSSHFFVKLTEVRLLPPPLYGNIHVSKSKDQFLVIMHLSKEQHFQRLIPLSSIVCSPYLASGIYTLWVFFPLHQLHILHLLCWFFLLSSKYQHNLGLSLWSFYLLHW